MLPEYEKSREIFEREELPLNREVYEKLDIYAQYLVEYNEKVNLTAITESRDILIKHFLDSILVVKYADIEKGAKIIDVGTGAGFPSVPLKIYRDDIQLTLLDSLNKRVRFLEQLSERLEIKTECIHSRAEDLAKDKKYRETYDIAVARAVAALPVLCEYCMPFVREGGKFFAMKGRSESGQEAENAVKLLGGVFENTIEYTIPDNDFRRIFIIKKISHTPIKYPRNSGQIKSKPL